MTCDSCENRMCKDAPFFTQERIAKDCLNNGRKLYVPPIKNTCGLCKHFIGMGDWNLCCDISHPTPKEKERGEYFPCGHLCYEDTEACDAFEYEIVARWKGAGMGEYYCSHCQETVSGNRNLRCPNCKARMYTNEEYYKMTKEWELEDELYGV